MSSSRPLPIVLIPALYCSARLYQAQIPLLWRYGQVTVAQHTCGSSIAEIAESILWNAPPRFALVGLSMGGYTALEIMRSAPERVVKLALLNTSARPDTVEQAEGRRRSIDLVQEHGLDAHLDQAWRLAVAPSRRNDPALRALYRQIAWDVGPEQFILQQRAIHKREDSRPILNGISCPTLVLVGDSDLATPPHLALEMADGIPRARLATVADCGHLSTIERPEAVTQALCEWMAG